MWEHGNAEAKEWFGKRNTHNLCIESLKRRRGVQQKMKMEEKILWVLETETGINADFITRTVGDDREALNSCIKE